jgi:hypothetical protein
LLISLVDLVHQFFLSDDLRLLDAHHDTTIEQFCFGHRHFICAPPSVDRTADAQIDNLLTTISDRFPLLDDFRNDVPEDYLAGFP